MIYPLSIQIYADFYDGADGRRQRAFAHADTPEVTTVAIEHALMSRTPHTRYVVANTHRIPAWITAKIAWLLPDRASDALFAQQDAVASAFDKS